MSLDTRPLPEGWVATFDNNYKATFYVNTTKTPPESTWVHPSDVPAFAPSPGPPPSKPTETETSAHNPDVKVGEREFQQAALASPSSSSAPAFSQTSYNQAVEPPKKKGGFGGFLAKLTDKIPQQQQHQQQEKQHSFGQSPYSQPPTGGPPPQFMGHQQQGYQNYPVQGGGPGGYGGPGQYGGGYPQQQQHGYDGHDQQHGYDQGHGGGHYGHQGHNQGRSGGGGGMGMGGVALAGVGGLVGGTLLMNALDGDDEQEAYQDGYQDAQEDGGDDE